MKDAVDKTKCIVDEEAAETVRLLFRLYAEGSVEFGKTEQRLIEAESIQELRDIEKEKVTSAMDILTI